MPITPPTDGQDDWGQGALNPILLDLDDRVVDAQADADNALDQLADLPLPGEGAGERLIIYYGIPANVNLVFSTEYAAQVFSRWDHIVFGEGLQEVSHPDHVSTLAVMARIRELNPRAKIYGYVSLGVTTVNLTEMQMKDRVDKWLLMGADGMLLDEYGYDYHVPRLRQNMMVDYVHGKNMIAFVNVWELDDAFSQAVEPTYNPGGFPTTAGAGDYVLLESWIVNNQFYASPYFASAFGFRPRADKARMYRETLGVKWFGGSVVDYSLVDEAKQAYYFDITQDFARLFGADGWAVDAFNYAAGGNPGNIATAKLWEYDRTGYSREADYSISLGWDRFERADLNLIITQNASTLEWESASAAPLDFGLVADGTTDNTTAFASAVAATPTGGTLTLQPGIYKGNIVVTKPMKISAYGVELVATAAGTKQIDIQADDVTIEGMLLTGTGSGTYNAASYGIYSKAASYVTRYANITLRDLTFRANANHCVNIEFAENVTVENCHASDFARTAFGVLSVDGFYLDRWSAVGATMPSGVTNAYGVFVSRNSNVDLATQPRSKNFVITRGYVRDINWEGIDTHGGTDGYIGQNEVYHCLVGIAIVSSADSGGTSTYAPHRVIVDSNIVDSEVTNGTYSAGIVVQGAGTGAGVFVEKAGFCSVTNNKVSNHGIHNTSQAGGIQVYLTTGTIVTNNFVDACCINAITFWHTNTGGVIAGNVLRDFWSSNDVFRPAGVCFVSTHNDNVVVTGNTTLRGAKVDDDITVFRINERGFSAVSGTDNIPIVGINNWDDVVTRVNDASQLTEARIESKNIYIGINDPTNQKIGFRGATPIVRPAAYTQTYSTAERTLGAYTADVENVAYTGNPAALTDALTKVDGNALRVAYENLRLFTEDLAQQHNALLDDMQSYGLLA